MGRARLAAIISSPLCARQHSFLAIAQHKD
jgi:hypothetical protein